MQKNRIPQLTENTFDGMLWWFAEMSKRDLLFHPDDAPDQIVNINTGAPTFSPDECTTLEAVISRMFNEFGDEVHAAAYPIFMKAAGEHLDS